MASKNDVDQESTSTNSSSSSGQTGHGVPLSPAIHEETFRRDHRRDTIYLGGGYEDRDGEPLGHSGRSLKWEPREFKGRTSDDVEEWVRQFKDGKAMVGWDSTKALRVLPVYLREAARDWWEELGQHIQFGAVTANPDRILQEVYQALVARFADPQKRENARVQLKHRVQKKEERVTEYLNALESLFQRGEVKIDEERQRYFEDGLNSDLRVEVLRSRPKTLVAAYKAACEWETVLSRVNPRPQARSIHMVHRNEYGQRDPMISGQFESSGSSEGPDLETRRVLLAKRGFRSVGRNVGPQREARPLRNTGRSSFEGTCNYCGIYGHKEAECRKKQRGRGNRQSEPPIPSRKFTPSRDGDRKKGCFFCGDTGHYVANCPQCKHPDRSPDTGTRVMSSENKQESSAQSVKPSDSDRVSTTSNSSGGSSVSLSRQHKQVVARQNIGTGDVSFSVTVDGRTQESLPSTSFFVDGELGGLPMVDILIDSGAHVSLIPNILYERMPTLSRPALEGKPRERIESATGGQIKVVGMINVNVILSGIDCGPLRMAVVDDLLSPQVILGSDWLSNMVEFIHIRDKFIALQHGGVKREIPFRVVHEGKEAIDPSRCRVRTVQQVLIPGLSEKWIEVEVDSTKVSSNHLLVEAIPIGSSKAVTAQPGVVHIKGGQAKELVRIALLNTSEATVKLGSGEEVGSAEGAEIIYDSMSDYKSQDGNSDIWNGSHTVAIINWQHVNMGPDLSDLEKLQLFELLAQYNKIAAVNPKSPEVTTEVTHSIDTGDARPIKTHPHRMSQAQHDIIQKEVEAMLKGGIIELAYGEWSSAVVLVKKPDGTWRFCVDYRRLNAVTKKDVYPLPRVDDTLDQLGKARYFTTIDLASGYWQIRMNEKDKEKTTFATREGLYQFIRMPFGLCNAPATFQRMMNNVLRGLVGRFVLVYIDDIIIYSWDFASHVQHLGIVLERLREANLQAKPSKCKIAFHEVQFLGHIVSAEGIRMDPRKVQAMVDFPRPVSIPTLRSFLGLVNYYRRFVSHFATLAQPLYQLTEKDVIWEWSGHCEEAFINIKNALTAAPILCAPDPSRPYVLQTDASDYGLGAVLSQRINSTGEELVIGYASRSLRKAERNYHTTEKECLAIVWAIKQFRAYLWGVEFLVETDHSALSWLHKMREPTGRLARWIMALQEYSFKIIHRPGRDNANADALSRSVQIGVVTRSRGGHLSQNEGRSPATTVTEQKEETKMKDEILSQRKRGMKGRKEEKEENTKNSIAETVMRRRGTSTGPWYGEEDKVAEDEEWEIWPEAMQKKSVTTTSPNELSDIQKSDHEEPYSIMSDQNAKAEEPVRENIEHKYDTSVSLAEKQRHDNDLAYLFTYLESGQLPGADSGKREMILEWAKHCKLRDGIIIHVQTVKRGKKEKVIEQLFIPKSMRESILRECHDGITSGHFGVDRTYNTVRDRFYWPGMYLDVKAWVQSCELCGGGKQPKPSTRTAPIGTLPIPTSPFEIVSVDIMGPLQPTPRGNRFIIVFTDFLTRWPEAVALPNQESKTIAKALVDNIICRHGAPNILLSDRGTPFRSELAQAVYELLAIEKRSTTAYRPQCNGKTERFNKTLATILRMYVAEDQTDWDEWIPYALLAYRCAYHEILKETPFFILYGREPRLPIDLALHTPSEHFNSSDEWLNTLHIRFDRAHSLAVEALKEQNEKREAKEEGIIPPTYEVGSRVYVFFPQVKRKRTIKLTHRWTGPWVVRRKITGVQYEVELEEGGRKQMVHVSRLKPYISRQDMERLNELARAARMDY